MFQHRQDVLKVAFVLFTFSIGVSFCFRGAFLREYGSRKTCSEVGSSCSADYECCGRAYCQPGRWSTSTCAARSETYGPVNSMEGQACSKTPDCGPGLCCETERMGYRGAKRQVCRSRCTGKNKATKIDTLDDGGSNGYSHFYRFQKANNYYHRKRREV